MTGANRGIGFAIVKRLAELGLTVVLTARDGDRGINASESLRSQGLHVWFSQLDVSDAASVEGFVSWFRQKFASLDVLVSGLHSLSPSLSPFSFDLSEGCSFRVFFFCKSQNEN